MKKKNIHTDPIEPEEILKRFSRDQTGNEAFKVPDGYFDSLPERIRSEISSQISGKLNFFSIQNFFTIRRVWAPVLAVAILFIAIFLLLPHPESTHQSLLETTDTLNLNTAYDASYAGEAILDEYININKLIEESTLTDEVELSFVTTSDDGISGEDICDYLQAQVLDTEVLAEMQIDLSTDL
jgi:hypothetical protein